MIKTLLKLNFIRAIASVSFLFSASFVFAQVDLAAGANNVSDLGTTCTVAGVAPITDATAKQCTFTPSVYKMSLFEMGLCTAHPFGANKLSDTFLTTNCVVTYVDSAPSQLDVAALLGGAPSTVSGTSTPPPEGTYSFVYMVMSSTFNIAGVFVHPTAGTFASTANLLSIDTTVGAVGVEAVDTLTNFADSLATDCGSGFTGAAVPEGTMDAFLTDAALTRSPFSLGATGRVCDKSDKIIGVMTMNTPVTVTSDTTSVVFNFNLTNQGVQFFDDVGTFDGSPDGFGIGPFSGSFTVTNN